MNDAELDDSWAVAVLTWALYIGWLTILAAVALWIGVEPLPSVQQQWPGTGGTIAALGVGVAFILASRQLYDVLRSRYGPSRAPEPGPEVAAADGTPSPPHQKRKKKKRKKKKRKQVSR